jgi:hypothetical protein
MLATQSPRVKGTRAAVTRNKGVVVREGKE